MRLDDGLARLAPPASRLQPAVLLAARLDVAWMFLASGPAKLAD